MIEQKPTPQDYADLFEVDKRGQRILEDLICRFVRPSVTDGIKFDDGTVHFYRHIACDSEYPEEGYLALGNEIDFDE